MPSGLSLLLRGDRREVRETKEERDIRIVRVGGGGRGRGLNLFSIRRFIHLTQRGAYLSVAPHLKLGDERSELGAINGAAPKLGQILIACSLMPKYLLGAPIPKVERVVQNK